jgi:hypothetical protein
MEALAKVSTIGYASLSLLLGWFAAIVGFLFLAGGIAGAIVGQIIWSMACGVIAGARGRLERRTAQTEPASERYT